MPDPDSDSDDGAPAAQGDGPRQWTTFAVISAIVIPVVGIIVTIVLTLSSSGSSAPQASDVTSPVATRTVSELEQCMLGLWIQQDHLPTGFGLPPDGRAAQSVTRAGSLSLYFGSDGSGKAEFALQFTGSDNGKPAEVDIRGTDAFNYTVQNSTVQYTRTSNTARQVLYVDGKQVGAPEPLAPDLVSQQVDCSPGRLRLGEADGDWNYNRP